MAWRDFHHRDRWQGHLGDLFRNRNDDASFGLLLAMLDARDRDVEDWVNTNLPRGFVAPPAIATSNQVAITTVTDLTGLSVAFVADPQRRYMVDAQVLALSSVVGDEMLLSIRNSSSAYLQQSVVASESATYAQTIRTSLPLSGLTAGPYTVKLSLERQAGTGTLAMAAGATYPAFLSVTDMGPA